MTRIDTDTVLVVLNVRPGLEEAVVDWLLGSDAGKAFTSMPTFGHSAGSAGLSIAEQVTGRRRRLRFEVAMPRPQCRSFLDEAAARFGKADVYAMVLPILAAGDLADVRDALTDTD